MGDGGNLRGAGTVTVRMRQMRRWRKVIVISWNCHMRVKMMSRLKIEHFRGVLVQVFSVEKAGYT